MKATRALNWSVVNCSGTIAGANVAFAKCPPLAYKSITCISVDLPPLWKYGPLNSVLRSEETLKVPSTSFGSVRVKAPDNNGKPYGFRIWLGKLALPAPLHGSPFPGTLTKLGSNSACNDRVHERLLPNGSLPFSPGSSAVGRTPMLYQPAS